MKIIRMTKTMAGPGGTFMPGTLRTVDDDTAAMLIGAEAAELARGVKQPALEPVADPEPAEAETANVDPNAETATDPKAADGETTSTEPTLEPDADPNPSEANLDTELVEEETAAVEPAPETAVIEAPRKKVKK